MKNLLIAAILLLGLSSCDHKKNKADTVKFPPPVVEADMEVADPGVKSMKGDPNADIVLDKSTGNADANQYTNEDNNKTKVVSDTSRKIIKDGDITFETDNITTTRKKILYSLKKLGGYVVEDNEATDNDEHRKEYTLKLRVPANSFDLLLDTVSATADKIDSKNISITDVTTKFIDITTRLANKKLLEGRYLDLLKKAARISDLLEIENKLTEIRSDIESTQGQLNYLNKQVAYSSLDITFYTKETTKADKGSGFTYKLKRSLNKGWHFLQDLFYKTIALWPLWMLVVLLYLSLKIWRKRRRLNTDNQ